MQFDDLVAAAKASQTFTRSGKDRAILAILADHSSHQGTVGKAKRLMALSNFLAGATDTIPMAVRRFQQRLDRFFGGPEGKEFPIRLDVVRGSEANRQPSNLYALIMRQNSDAGLCTNAFWQPHLSSVVPTWIVYGEPLFTLERRRDRDIYTRDVLLNRPADIPSRRPPAYPFVRLGEVRCMLEFTRWFAKHRVPLFELSCRHDDGLELLTETAGLATNHVIVLGNSFANGILQAYQDHQSFPFFLEGAIIRERRGGPAGKVLRTYRDGKDERTRDCVTTHALVSRRRHYNANSWVTMIASDNGRAIFRIGQLLCSESDMNALCSGPLEQMAANGWQTEFQILFKIWVYDFGTTAIGYKVITSYCAPS